MLQDALGHLSHRKTQVHRGLLDPPERLGFGEPELLLQHSLGPVECLPGGQLLPEVVHLPLELAQLGAILSPMPGRIIAVDVAAGDIVTKGQKLVTLEAMKMEHSLTAPFDGTVAELSAASGGQVSEGTVLVRIARAD